MKTSKFCSGVTALFLLGMFTGAHAQSNLQYSFVEVAYGQSEVDIDVSGVSDVDADLIGVGASFGFGDNFFIQVAYEDADFDDVFGVDVEGEAYLLGFGAHVAASANVDWVFDLNYVYAEIEACGFGICIDEDDNGYSLGVGLRSLLASDKIELAARLGYLDVGDSSGDATVGASFRYHFNDSFSGSVGVSGSEDVTTYGVRLRVAW